MLRRAPFLACCVFSLACGSGSEEPSKHAENMQPHDNSPGMGSGGASGGAGGGAGENGAGTGGQTGQLPEGYPTGPYGASNPDVGDVIENLRFRGFANPTAEGLANLQPYADYSMNDLRLSGPRYALIHIGALW